MLWGAQLWSIVLSDTQLQWCVVPWSHRCHSCSSIYCAKPCRISSRDRWSPLPYHRQLGTKRLPLESVLAACCQQCVPLSTGELRSLVERLNLAEGPRQLVIYSLLVATLNWKDRLTLGHLERE